MDNDTLINQARRLYALLHVKQHALAGTDQAQAERLEHLVESAYHRYLRRLNRCAVCYKGRLNDCNRESLDSGRRFCPNCCRRLPKHQPDNGR